MKTAKNWIMVILPAVLLMFWAKPVLAVQNHGGIEGLVAHQLAHILFLFGIAYLLQKIRRNGYNDSGWFEFKLFLWLIIAWNFLTFTGHWLNGSVDPAGFTKFDGRITAYSINDFSDAYFYLTRLDHLLLVPAFLCLFLALRKWREEK